MKTAGDPPEDKAKRKADEMMKKQSVVKKLIGLATGALLAFGIVAAADKTTAYAKISDYFDDDIIEYELDAENNFEDIVKGIDLEEEVKSSDTCLYKDEIKGVEIPKEFKNYYSKYLKFKGTTVKLKSKSKLQGFIRSKKMKKLKLNVITDEGKETINFRFVIKEPDMIIVRSKKVQSFSNGQGYTFIIEIDDKTYKAAKKFGGVLRVQDVSGVKTGLEEKLMALINQRLKENKNNKAKITILKSSLDKDDDYYIQGRFVVDFGVNTSAFVDESSYKQYRKM